MRKQFIHYPRAARLLISAMFRMASDDPVLFLEKISQRLKQTPLRAVFKYFPADSHRSTTIQKMFDEG